MSLAKKHKIDLCENEKCSKNGICFDSGNEAKCKCFTYFSGDKCEIESNEINNVKIVISTASIIAIIILVMTYCCMIFSDFSKLFCKFNKSNRDYRSNHHHHRIKIQKFQKLIYIN